MFQEINNCPWSEIFIYKVLLKHTVGPIDYSLSVSKHRAYSIPTYVQFRGTKSILRLKEEGPRVIWDGFTEMTNSPMV